MERVAACVQRYAEVARSLGSETPYATATSAVRDARNGDAFLEMLERRCGVRARAIDGGQEARLTLRGVASSRSIEQPRVRCDIGGGSTELIAGDGEPCDAGDADWGLVRMSERTRHRSAAQQPKLTALRAQVAEILPGDVPAGDLIGVAGTVTTLAAIDLDIERELPS